MRIRASISGYSSQSARYHADFSSIPEINSRMMRETRRISAHLLFYIAPRRDCRVSPGSLTAVTRLCGSYPQVCSTRTGVTRCVILRSPDFPPYLHRAATFCLLINAFLIASVANLSALLFSSRGIWLTKTFSNPLKRCTERSYKPINPACLTL